ncbi:MAG: extracellular solute-binding protein, partial [Chloroflexota bacterium]
KHPTTAAELKKLLQDLTNPNKGQWGTTAFSGTAYGAGGLMYMGMFGGPNVWRLESDGKFTKDLETPAAKEAAAYVRDLVAAGVFDPGTNTYNILTAGDAFGSGKAALFGAGWPGYQRFWDQGLAAKPPMAVRSLLPFGADGGKGVYMLGVSNFGVIAMKKASESRVKELLSIINYLASPFGSEESLLLDYGVQRTDHNLDAKGNPVLTNKGKSDVAVPWSFIGRRPPVLYDPTSPDFAKVAQQDEQGMLPAGIQDPTLGLYSPTWVKKGPVINKAFVDGLNLIVSGQQPISQYDQLVKDWQSGGGNQIKQEYAQALAATK